MKSEITVGVLGLGHVGLPTAVGFAELGWLVLGWDDFNNLCKLSRHPVYALGGLNYEDHINLVKKNGGVGIAAISYFWEKKNYE